MNKSVESECVSYGTHKQIVTSGLNNLFQSSRTDSSHNWSLKTVGLSPREAVGGLASGILYGWY